MLVKNILKNLAAAAVLTVMASGVNAAVITVDDTNPASGNIQGTLTCVVSCEGYVGSATWSATNALMFTIQPNSLANETTAVNAITGENFATGSKYNLVGGDDGENFSFFSNALYILFKIGGQDPSHFLIKNTSPGLISFNWLKGNDTGTGLSHYTQFGTAPVPVPAAGLLLIGALGGLVALRRRKTA